LALAEHPGTARLARHLAPDDDALARCIVTLRDGQTGSQKPHSMQWVAPEMISIVAST